MADTGRRRGPTGYLLMVPAVVWLGLFFVIPFYSLVAASLYDPSGSDEKGWDMSWAFGNYPDAWDRYWEPLLRSIAYGAIATLICLVLGYLLAYVIAFKVGRWKTLLLVLVIAPFFTSFLVRTLSWQLILADDGWLVDALQWMGIVRGEGLLYTDFSVIMGLAYNFLPFMVLPLFASIDKIDPRLIEASSDLYSNPVVGFFKVTWPLSLPGVVSGTLLTFIPAAGDYINAQLLGNTSTTVIGSVIELQATDANQPQVAAALAMTLMVLIVGMVLVYVRRAGTEELF